MVYVHFHNFNDNDNELQYELSERIPAPCNTDLFRQTWHLYKLMRRLKSSNGSDVTKRAIIDVNSIVSGMIFTIFKPRLSVGRDVTAIWRLEPTKQMSLWHGR